MTASAASEQIDLERNGERGKEKMKESGERQVVSGTIQLPSELYWISPPFKIKRQISLNPPLDPRGRITFFLFFFFKIAQEPVSPFSKSPLYNSEHCGILLLKLCIFKYQVKLQKRCIIFFFYCIFIHVKEKKICVVCVYVL